MLSPGRKLAVAVALLLLLGGATLGLWQVQTAQSYRETTGTVTDASLESYDPGGGTRTGTDTTRYRLAISYEYTVDGESYTASNVAFGSVLDTTSRSRAERVRGQFAAGEPVTVYYDPADPSQAYLLPRFDFLPAGGLVIAGLLVLADALTPWSRVTRALLRRVPVTMYIGSRFRTERPATVGIENPTAILDVRETLDAPKTAPLSGADASAVWLCCGLGILLTVLSYLHVSAPPYDIAAMAVLSLPLLLVGRVLLRAHSGSPAP